MTAKDSLNLLTKLPLTRSFWATWDPNDPHQAITACDFVCVEQKYAPNRYTYMMAMGAVGVAYANIHDISVIKEKLIRAQLKNIKRTDLRAQYNLVRGAEAVLSERIQMDQCVESRSLCQRLALS